MVHHSLQCPLWSIHLKNLTVRSLPVWVCNWKSFLQVAKKSIRCVINHLNIDYKSKINYRLISYTPRNNWPNFNSSIFKPRFLLFDQTSPNHNHFWSQNVKLEPIFDHFTFEHFIEWSKMTFRIKMTNWVNFWVVDKSSPWTGTVCDGLAWISKLQTLNDDKQNRFPTEKIN